MLLAKQIHYHNVIFQDCVYKEIQVLQEKLSRIDRTPWSISNVVNLLLGFYFDKTDNWMYNQKFPLLQEYLTEKSGFFDEFVADVLLSIAPYD